MKTSLITTVLNEEKTIVAFLRSIAKQTKLPDEIIIVDGGSTDKTLNLISNFKYPISKNKIKIIQKKGNRSVGRNTAIKHTTNDIILVSDVGCILDKNWVKEITLPFIQQKAIAVSGFYLPVTKTIFQKALSMYTCTPKEKLNEKTFLPSSRSVAFKKSVWEKVKGYPENLDTCEDLIFDKKIQHAGFTFVLAEKALVYWPQKTNLFQAAKQFFTYAKGDGQAHYFRTSTPLLFLRYIFGLSLLRVGSMFNNTKILTTCYLLLSTYILWAIKKNYKYLHQKMALLYLPILQITSDITVIFGTTFGFFQNLLRKLIYVIKTNKIISGIIFLYCITSVLQISWGTPNASHPFSYHMDEWAQAQSLRTTFSKGTPHIFGGGNGTYFFYIVSGIMLAPFILLDITNPFTIHNSIRDVLQLQTLFEVLRLQSIAYGVGSIILISYIARKWFKVSGKLTAFFFTVNPIFLLLTIFYRYDVAVLFWIILSIFFSLRYITKPTKKNLIISAIISALTIGVKVSALPLFLIYITTFFLATPQWHKIIKLFIFSCLLFIAVTVISAIPDALLSFKDFLHWFLYSSVGNQAQTSIYSFGVNYKEFLLFQAYPATFGHAFYYGALLSILVSYLLFIKHFLKRTIAVIQKSELFLVVSLLLFAISLIPLQIGAHGNRMLVFLPFMSLFFSIFVYRLFTYKKKYIKLLTVGIVLSCILLQIIESTIWLSIKLGTDVRQVSSMWVEKNISKNTTIGIENIPIFQGVPNIALKEFYTKQYFSTVATSYNWVTININDEIFPNVVILVDRQPEEEFYTKTPKKTLFRKLQKQHFTLAASFSSDFYNFKEFYTDNDYTFASLIPNSTTIEVFKRN